LFKPATLARRALVMAATLACYGVGLAVEHWGQQHVDLVVLAVAITVMLAGGRSSGRNAGRGDVALKVLQRAVGAVIYGISGKAARPSWNSASGAPG
jgi:hypothetical protein